VSYLSRKVDYLRGCMIAASMAVLCFPRPASAVEIGDEQSPLSLEVHAFASQGFIYSLKNNYIADNSTHGSFQFSEIGINFTKPLTDRLRAGLQLFAQDLGPTGNYDVKADWFYLDYRFADWLGVRAGRVKIPFGLYNEVNDIDSARLPILLPQSVYPIDERTYLLAQTGGEIYGYANLGDAGALDYRVYGGTIVVDPPAPTSAYTLTLNVPYLVGGRLLWETPLQGLRAGGSFQALRLDGNYSLLPANTPVSAEVPVILALGSIEYAAHDLVLSAEYSRWYASLTSSNPALIPSSALVINERGYAMASYRLAPWLQVGVYDSLYFPDAHHPAGRQNLQNDLATTLRFDVNTHWLIKLETHYMSGTAALSPTLNNGAALGSLDKSWEVLLLKTTAYF
jgi:hypothetical protein